MIPDSPPVAIPRLYECPTPRSDGLVLVEDLAAQVDAVAADLHWSGAPTKLACRWSMRRFDQTSGPATSLAAEAAAGFVSGGIDRDEPRQRRSALSPVAEPGARSSTHGAQMNTIGPLISVRPSASPDPHNEHAATAGRL
jgi:hypothetical protein